MKKIMGIMAVSALLFAGFMLPQSAVRGESEVKKEVKPTIVEEKKTTSSKPAPSLYFEKNLYFGLFSNIEVIKLQEFLTDQGFYTGPITGNFYILTLQGVRKFQGAYGIPTTGYFGPLSRAKANEIVKKIIGEICMNESEEGCDDTTPNTLSIVTESNLRGKVGEPFSATFMVKGGSGHYAIAGDGAIPGLSWSSTMCPNAAPGTACIQMVNPSAIALIGTPAKAGKYTVTVTAKEQIGTIYCITAPCPQPEKTEYRYGKAQFTVTIEGNGVEASSIQVITPNGKEALYAGKTYKIAWKYPNGISKSANIGVRIVLLQPVVCITAPCNDQETVLAHYVSASGTSWAWTIPADLSGQYRIKVELIDKVCPEPPVCKPGEPCPLTSSLYYPTCIPNILASDESDALFTVQNAPNTIYYE